MRYHYILTFTRNGRWTTRAEVIVTSPGATRSGIFEEITRRWGAEGAQILFFALEPDGLTS